MRFIFAGAFKPIGASRVPSRRKIKGDAIG
jgi:hypothetical protein